MEIKELEPETSIAEAKKKLFAALLAEEGIVLPQAQVIKRSPRNSQGCPLSFAQQRLWILDQFDSGSGVYNIPAAVRLTGTLDAPSLQASLDEIVRRHEALRTAFVNKAGEPVQVVIPPESLVLSIVDLRSLPESERESRVMSLARAEAQQPFDLSQAPLVRATLLCTKMDEHVLLLTMHHIVSDGWSMHLFISELAALYPAFVAGEPSPLLPLAIQYADFAQWERERLQGEVLAEQLNYWKQQLADLPAFQLQSDRPRQGRQTFHGATHKLRLDRRLSAQLKALGQEEEATLFMTLLAAFNVLLFRHTGQPEIVLGIPVANRDHAEIQNLIGFFVNTLVLRTRLGGGLHFRELLRRIREAALGAYAHQNMPFEKLVEELHPTRDLSHSPLFQVMFQLLDAPLPPAALAGLKMSLMEVESGTAKFDLTLSMIEDEQGLLAVMEYNRDLFDEATVGRMLGHLKIMLEGIVADPEQPLSSLPLLSEDEREQLLTAWNQTASDYPRQDCIHQLFEQQAGHTPQSVALIAGDEQLSYRELDERANQLAHYLRMLGVGTETRVGLCLPRSVEMVVALLAILKAGGAYVPLDPTYPQERLSFMLKDARLPVLLTLRSLASQLPETDATLICLDTDGMLIAQQSRNGLPSLTAPENLAYVDYTSGSTGVPKGVEISHRNVVRLLCGASYARLDKAQTILHLSPISFDASTFEVWGALLHGGKCVLHPEQVPTATGLSEAIARYGVNTMWLTASLFNTVVAEKAEALRGVKQLLIGGEALSVWHVREALEKLDGTTIINGYGPTEGTTFSCCYQVERELLKEGLSAIPIGRAINNTQAYVLDEMMNVLPIGVCGELYIGGEGLARGYMRRPGQTAERFVPHPYSARAGDRLYRTGDVVRWKEGGVLEYVGRMDHQVKVRGFRIELGEIEAVLSQHPLIKETVVTAAAEGAIDKRLVAYVAVDREAAPPASELRDYLRVRLPAYMIPSTFVMLNELPLNANGKVDRKALPALDQIQTEPGENFVAPRVELEQQVADIFALLLEVSRVGIHDNFFDLGGHSLLATQLLSRLRNAFDVELSLVNLFEAPTVAELCVEIVQAQVRQEDDQELAAVIADLENLSEADIKELLENRMEL